MVGKEPSIKSRAQSLKPKQGGKMLRGFKVPGKIKSSLLAIPFIAGLIAFIIPQSTLADEPDTLWTKTYGGSDKDRGYSVQQTSDGGYIIAGYTESYGVGRCDVWLIKTDSEGNKEWDKTFGGSDWDWGLSVQQTSDGGYIIVGGTESYGAGSTDVWLIKTDSEGNKEWDKTFGGSYEDWGESVQQTSDGGYIITGGTESYAAGYSDVWLIKTDSEGNKEWDKTFSGAYAGWGLSVQQTSDGGYIIAGWIYSGDADFDVWLIKTDSEGNKEWDKTFGGSSGDWSHSVQQTSDGGYIIAGKTASYGAGGGDIWLIKTDSEGNKEWDKIFRESSYDVGYSVQQTSDGGYIITGGTESYGAGWEDVWLIKADSEGNKEWDKIFGGSLGDCGYSVQQTSDGGYIIAGETYSYGAGWEDVYLIRLTSEAAIITLTSPHNFQLLCYPIPAKQSMTIKFSLPQESFTTLKLYNVSGRLIKTLFSGKRPAGTYQIDWNTKELPSGIYFLRLETEKQSLTRRIVIVK